jgi:hypothetical protein
VERERQRERERKKASKKEMSKFKSFMAVFTKSPSTNVLGHTF